MEKVLSPEEKLRRAEQIYYQRKERNIRENKKTVNVPVSNKKYVLRKMIIQIVICFLIYCAFFIIKNYNFIFSKEMIDKTNELLSYDINIQEIYCKIANYINNYEYFNKKEDEKESKLTEENKIVGNNDEDIVHEVNIDALSATDVTIAEDEQIQAQEDMTQMDIDANEIKQRYLLISPLNGQITSRFGPREVTSEVVSAYHVGLDIAADTGTVFVASMEGEVVYSGELSGYGNCIQTQKDDILIIYGHCSKLYVNKGDMVTQGQELGEVGQTGNATGPHLHFEIRKSGRYVDPEKVF